MISATKIVVAGATVALFGGLLYTGVLEPQGQESAVPGTTGTAVPSAAAESATPSLTVESSLTAESSELATPELAFTGREIIVAQDANGDYETINEAIDAASDGDLIRLRPGTYDEMVDIDKDIALVGDGPREDIVIAPREVVGEPIDDIEVGSMNVNGADVRLAGLTVRSPAQFGPALVVRGGSAELDDLGAGIVTIVDDADSVVRESAIRRFSQSGGTVTIAGNQGDVAVNVDGAVISDNVGIIEAAGVNAMLDRNTGDIHVRGDDAVVTGNSGGRLRLEGDSARVTANDFGVIDVEGSGHELRDNVIRNDRGESTVAVRIGPATSDIILAGNTIEGDRVGVAIRGGDGITLDGNSISAGEVAVVTESSDVTFAGNTLCGVAMDVMRGLDVDVDLSGNELCRPVPERWTDESGWTFDRLTPGIDVLVDDGFGHRLIEGYGRLEDVDDGQVYAMAGGSDGVVRIWKALPDDVEEHLIDVGGKAVRMSIGQKGDPLDDAWDYEDGKSSGPAPKRIREVRALWEKGTSALSAAGPGPSRIVEKLGVSPDGTLWALVRTRNGQQPARFNGKRWKVFPQRTGSSRVQLHDGAVDRDGRLWFHGDLGLTVYDGRTSKVFLEGISGGQAAAAADGRGRIYTTALGLTVVDPTQVDLD